MAAAFNDESGDIASRKAIIGASKMAHVDQAIEALGIHLARKSYKVTGSRDDTTPYGGPLVRAGMRAALKSLPACLGLHQLDKEPGFGHEPRDLTHPKRYSRDRTAEKD
jgi:hypothetical protein